MGGSDRKRRGCPGRGPDDGVVGADVEGNMGLGHLDVVYGGGRGGGGGGGCVWGGGEGVE